MTCVFNRRKCGPRLNPDLVGDSRCYCRLMRRLDVKHKSDPQQNPAAMCYHGTAVWNVQGTALDPHTGNNATTSCPMAKHASVHHKRRRAIVKNKTFFFALFDGRSRETRALQCGDTLTPCARRGIFVWDRWNNDNRLYRKALRSGRQ